MTSRDVICVFAERLLLYQARLRVWRRRPEAGMHLVLGLLATMVATAQGQPVAAPVVPHRAELFPPRDVRLLDGPFKQSQDTHARYLLSLEPDRLLSRFRTEAGLTPKGSNYPGWEDRELPGVGAGFYLSGCARMYAGTGDKRFLDRLTLMLDELEACQAANGNGYLLATRGGKRIFAEIERGDIRFEGGWLLNGEAEPYYALEKLFSGLRDAHRIAGMAKGLTIAVKLADWLDQHMAHLSDDQLQRIMACEFGGMNWVLADLYADTGDARYLALSRRWDHKAILDPLARGEDILPGKHANTQFPKISGLAARFPLTGEPTDRIVAEFFWDRVVNHHSYVTGDNSLAEHFGPPDKLDNRLAGDTTESCNAWNMLRLTGLLTAIEPRAEYGNFCERVLWNHILPAQHPSDGRICYFLPLESGHTKPYEGLYDRFACCTCSGFDSYARHGDLIYFHAAETLYVNLFIASELRWKDRGVTVSQRTRIPDEDVTRLTLTCDKPTRFRLAVRCPRWTTSGATVTLNGERQPVSGLPGSYLALDREWRTGDVIELTLPMPLRLETMPDNPRRVALFRGPILLAGDLGPADDSTSATPESVPSLVTDGRLISDWIKPLPDGACEFRLDGVGRPADVTLKPFFRLHERRYAVYWDMLTSEQWSLLQAERAAEQARRKRIDEHTVDRVEIGEAASEATHHLKTHQSNTGPGAYGKFMTTRWRDAPDGWFSYEMAVPPDEPIELLCTFWGKERGDRTFDVLIDGQKAATVSLDGNHPEAFYDRVLTIPTDMTRGKSRITVTFQAHPHNTVGGLFGLRILKAGGSDQ